MFTIRRLSARLAGGAAALALLSLSAAAAELQLKRVMLSAGDPATASALLVGVTLITMMAVGAATAERAVTDELDRRRPVDLEDHRRGARVVVLDHGAQGEEALLLGEGHGQHQLSPIHISEPTRPY